MRLHTGQVRQRQFQRVADGYAEPALARFLKPEARRVRAAPCLPSRAQTEISSKHRQRMLAELALRKPDPTVFPNTAGVIQEFLHFEVGLTGSFTTGDAPGGIAEET